MLSEDQKHLFQQQGYLVFPELFEHQQIQILKNAALRIVDEFDVESTRAVFSTETYEKDASAKNDEYFLSSDDKVRCFFEEDAFSSNDTLQHAKELCINKIGHALNSLVPEFNEFSRLPEIAQIA